MLGAVELAALRQARCNVVAVVPMAENAIDAKAYRPGDVIGSLAGLSIEILNTDAEGRLVVADGVTYARQIYDPAYIIDVATLNGSITGVLHEEFTAVYANDDGLKFAGYARWAHLDIAGTAWETRRKPSSNKGATGFGVRLFD